MSGPPAASAADPAAGAAAAVDGVRAVVDGVRVPLHSQVLGAQCQVLRDLFVSRREDIIASEVRGSKSQQRAALPPELCLNLEVLLPAPLMKLTGHAFACVPQEPPFSVCGFAVRQPGLDYLICSAASACGRLHASCGSSTHRTVLRLTAWQCLQARN